MHLLAAGYIVGHLFTFFWAAPQLMAITEASGSPSNTLYVTAGVLVTLTGFAGLIMILY